MNDHKQESSRQKNHKPLIKTVLFLLILAFAVNKLQYLFGLGDYSIYSRETGFKQERNDSLDAVYIGASHVFSFFQPPLAWNDYGIAVFSYAIPSMPPYTVKYRIIEARKTQPDALYIINLNCFKNTEVKTQAIHRSVDYMPWSKNKLEMMDTMLDHSDFEGMDRLEFYFPMLRFHSRWCELSDADFKHTLNNADGLKGAYTYNPFLTASEDQTKRYKFVDKREELTEDQELILYDLLDYIDQEDVNVLFVTVPQMLDSESLGQINTIEDIVQERGYDYLDLMDNGSDYQLKMDTDYHDSNHINIHGSIKFTKYLSEYLIENYGFNDKREESGWDSWNASVTKYADIIGPYCLDIEREHAPRDYSLSEPQNAICKSKDSGVSLQWDAVADAEGYAIYRKTKGENKNYWTRLGDTADTEYMDSEVGKETEYTYTIVPYRSVEGQLRYGNFDFSGYTVKTGK